MAVSQIQLASPFDFGGPVPAPLIAFSGSENGSPNSDSPTLQLQITAEANGTGWIIFRSERGMRYQLQASALTEPSEWISAGEVFVAGGDITQYQISLAPGTYFYRIAKLGGETTPVSAAPILAAADTTTHISQPSRDRHIFFSDPVFARAGEMRLISLTPLLLADDDAGGPSDWVAKVEWMLKNLPLIAHPLDGSSTK